MGVVVDVGKADAVAAPACACRGKGTQHARASSLKDVGEEEVVTWPVHLVRRHCYSHEVVTAGISQGLLASCLGGSVCLGKWWQEE